MGDQAHDPATGRFASGDGSGGKVTSTVRERNAMRAMIDARRFAQGRASNRNMNPTPMRATDVPHARGIMNATAGKTLAQVSAMGATTATIKSGGG